MKKSIFMTESGNFHSYKDMCSMVDYYERTGNCPDHFSRGDFDRFYDKYVIPYREGVSEDKFNNI